MFSAGSRRFIKMGSKTKSWMIGPVLMAKLDLTNDDPESQASRGGPATSPRNWPLLPKQKISELAAATVRFLPLVLMRIT